MRVRDVAVEAWREEERNDVRDIVESRASSVRDCKWHHRVSILRWERPYEEMDRLVTFLYHHMGSLKRGGDGNVIYDGGLVTEIHKSAMKNDNTVHLYFDHPIDANPEIVDEDMMSDGSSESVYEINPPVDNVNKDKVTNKVVDETNERENEVVNEATVEVNELNKGVSVVVNKIVNEVVNEATIEVNELNKGVSTVMNEDVNEINGDKDTEVASAPEKSVNKVRKRHPRLPLSGLPQERRAGETGQAEGDFGKAEIVNEATHENNANDANEDNVTQTNEKTNTRKNHPRPQPSGQRIVPEKDDEAPRVEVPNPNREDGDSGPEMYQYKSEELCSPPRSDDEEEPVFPQHNPNTPYEKITLELNMEFETMDHFKAAV
ncbi:hypothetical protein Ahy_B05g078747 [Arachis hypogaea]|uniref:Uncharacterized protein n=1 Tax=Arachis hypogaea TaxID=3818 RepID=A0A444Z7V8_ARAHY|nr:hypothetical protein Ahy_B05g078747 [Arachis hypogaea]